MAAATPKKGVYWEDKEVVLLLRSLVEMEAGPRVIPSMHLETISVFQVAVECLEKGEFQRMPDQARAKFKREKASFFDHHFEEC